MLRKKVYSLIFIFVIWLAPVSGLAAETDLYLEPANGNFSVGEVFPVTVKVSSPAEFINAAQTIIKLPNQFLSLQSFTVKDSIFTLWTDEPVLKGERFSLSGGLPQPGFKGEGGNILTLYLKVEKSGTARVNFVSGSVHANDGRGTNILDNMIGGTYTLLPMAVSPDAAASGLPQVPIISSLTHPDQSSWYQGDEGFFIWQLPAGIEAVSFLFDSEPNTIPPPVIMSATTSAIYSDIDNGISYFHLRLKNQIGWSQTANFRVMVDNIPPEIFTISSDTSLASSLNPKIYFKAWDQHSGIDYYEVVVDKGAPYITEAEEYQLADISQGFHEVVVTAVDKAGNKRQAQAELEIVPLPVKLKIVVTEFSLNQVFLFYYLLIVLMILLLLLLLWLRHRRKDKQEDEDMSEELDELNESVDFGFTTLRRDLLSEIDIIREREKTQGLSPTEAERLKKLKVDLDVVEGYVRKELRDVTELKAKKRGGGSYRSRRGY